MACLLAFVNTNFKFIQEKLALRTDIKLDLREFRILCRIWSKKYPIKITTNVRKPCQETEDSSNEIVPPKEANLDPAEASQTCKEASDSPSSGEDSMDTRSLGHVDDEEEEMHDAVGDGEEDDFEILPESKRSFYLFTRTSREKEEWFNRFMVGAKFMQDWNHQNPPKERTIRPDPNYETFKVKEQKFKMFMENYFQVRKLFL